MNRIFATLLALLAWNSTAQSQSFPNRPITIVVNSEAGGPTDAIARILKDGVQATLGQPVVIENRLGAGGAVGAASVVKSEPDGYTILMSGAGPMVTAPILFPDIGYDPLRDLQPINLAADVPTMLVSSSAVPAKTLAEFIALAKREPGKLTYGTAGRGTPGHFGLEAFRLLAGVEMLFIPYRGSPAAVLGLLNGELGLHIATPQLVLQHAEDGKIVLLAAISDKRLRQAPNVPTASEVGFPDLAIPAWFGYFAPKNTPRPAVDKLNEAISKALKDPKAIDSLTKAAFNIKDIGPDAYAAFHREEMARWRKVAAEANIKSQ